ncbi:phytanoyl-CoA dioxygenase family protein [Jannaschia sp. M317]|uniref:phytanoyl-CoA dioxygenase family protein n=1 Tax=Jannaschia sp. M317 TaxID=2867011 RepID=UPI0021A86DF5|nr:phytanoyl-CoA dioxygenase family protein [Jannaschia sp. M317]UWQ17963.1 phytanoyl-CoA dioxygenase family protein [Jannaschia sp. M317]
MTQLAPDMIDAFARDGAVVLRGLFAGHVEALRSALADNMAAPGPHAAENTLMGEAGRFFDDYVNWHRFPAMEAAARDPAIAGAAAALMQSDRVQLFHDHVLVKEPGTSRATPWHQDGPYYFVGGSQTVSFWVPLDPVGDATLRLVAGSHLWDRPVLPTRWVSQQAFFPGDYRPVPDPDAEGMPVLEWDMAPGDAVAFSFDTLHGARGNTTSARRRAFSLRFVGDDARVVARPGPTSPPFPGHGMQSGDRLREDWFPTVWSRQ